MRRASDRTQESVGSYSYDLTGRELSRAGALINPYPRYLLRGVRNKYHRLLIWSYFGWLMMACQINIRIPVRSVVTLMTHQQVMSPYELGRWDDLRSMQLLKAYTIWRAQVYEISAVRTQLNLVLVFFRFGLRVVWRLSLIHNPVCADDVGGLGCGISTGTRIWRRCISQQLLYRVREYGGCWYR